MAVFFSHVSVTEAGQALSLLGGLSALNLYLLLGHYLANRQWLAALAQDLPVAKDHVEYAPLQQQIDSDAHILVTLSAQASCNTVNQRIRRIEGPWSGIKQDLQQLSPGQSFTLHSELVGEVLYLIHDLGEECALLDSDSDFAYLANATINLLPLVTETQGQARGMATGAAARKACDIPLQVKLRYLIERTRTTIDTAKGELQGKLGARGLDDSLITTESFLQLLETQILNTENIDIAPDRIFAAGTQAIDKSFALLDHLIDALQQQLETEASRSQRCWRVSQLTATGLLAPAAWLLQLAV